MISAATSAALVASLVATVVAPAALASTTVTNFGSIPVAFGTATTTSGPFAVTFTENAINSFGTTGAGQIQVTVNDSSYTVPGPQAGITLGGTLVVTAPGYAGVTASVSGNVLTINSSGPWSTTLLEQLTVSGITVTIDSTVVTGALEANVTTASGDLKLAGFATSGNASGFLHTGVVSGATALVVDLTTTSCPFADTATAGADYFAGTTDLGTGTASAVGVPAAGQQTLTITTVGGAPTLAAGVTITQATACTAALPYALASPGTVTNGVKESSSAVDTVVPGENNQVVGSVQLLESAAGVIGVGTLTFTAVGGLFSYSPSVNYANGLVGSSVCNISFDRTSCTVSITTASTVAPSSSTDYSLWFGTTNVDVPATATNGSSVTIAVAGSPAFAVTGSPATVGAVARAVVAIASIPTVYIGFNDQPSGEISLTETSAGYFSSIPSAPTNSFEICLTSDYDHFTRLPMAIVTSGDLKLAAGSPIAPATQAVGTFDGNYCVYWTVYTSSTVASTIQIRGTDATGAILPDAAGNGPRLSIDPGANIGYVKATVGTGFGTDTSRVPFGEFVIATRANKNEPVVAAVSQPTLAPGTAKGKIGNITITETQAGQFQNHEYICLSLADLNMPNHYFYQADFVGSNVNDSPVVTTNTASGLIAMMAFWDSGSSYLCILVNQQAIGTLGVITLSNMNVSIPNDAALGPINVEVMGGFGNFNNGTAVAPTDRSFSDGQLFDQTVTVGSVGVSPKLNIAANSALGLNPTKGYTNVTPKYQAKGKYVTWKFTGGPALAGQRVNILVAKHVNGAWGGPVYLKSAWADANGIVTFAWTSKTAAAVNVRVQWPGSTHYAVSTSKALGAYWQ